MIKSRITLIGFLFVLGSCADNKKEDYIDESIVPTSTNNAEQAKAADTPKIESPIINPSNNNIVLSQPGNVQINPNTSSAKLNPPHGEPGHRCDISVGAPLDSKPTAMNPAPASPSPVTTSVKPGVQTVTPGVQTVTPGVQPVATGMNPAHGQPGHRCDIEVGKPLNSKPVAATTAPAQTKDAVPPVQVQLPPATEPQGNVIVDSSRN